jgi:hypothetical protein
MEVFRDLYVGADTDQMATVVEQIERSLPPGWARDREMEGGIESDPFAAPLTYCFTRNEEGRLPGATLFLAQKDPETFYVPNIIPVVRGQLSRQEYNSLLEEFYEHALRPSAEQSGLTTRLTRTDVGLDHWMSPATAEKLRTFSARANKGTGSSHPMDRERWNDFVLSAHQDGSRMDASILMRWLIEVEDWSPEVADQLAIEYAHGRELLAFAEKHRRSA